MTCILVSIVYSMCFFTLFLAIFCFFEEKENLSFKLGKFTQYSILFLIFVSWLSGLTFLTTPYCLEEYMYLNSNFTSLAEKYESLKQIHNNIYIDENEDTVTYTIVTKK